MHIHVSNGDVHRVFASIVDATTERQRFDGYYNNIGSPSWGAVGTLCTVISARK